MERVLSDRLADAIGRAFPEAADADPLLTVNRQPKLGDFQSNAAMPLSKRVGKPPREVALAIIGALRADDIAEPLDESSIAGPGFINIRLRHSALASALTAMSDGDLGVTAPERPRTIVIDLCGVNLAKQMHVGHLRSTIIGDSIARVFDRLGHRVIRQSHVGDWGLPIAMVTARLRDEMASGRLGEDDITLDLLDRLYKRANADATPDRRGLALVERFGLGPKAHAELEAQNASADAALADAKATLVKLQTGDPATVAIWRRIYDVTMRACVDTCARLNADVTLDHAAGESSYAEELEAVVRDLETRGVAEQSEGALVVRVEGVVEPCLIRKSDGGFLYATTDLAAIRRRVREMHADEVVYCVDSRQSLHFRQVFGAARKAGYATDPQTGREARLEHAAFGNVLGPDNRPLKTRSGENVRLIDLLDEAERRAISLAAERSPQLDETERQRVAAALSVAAIKYADLSSDRVKDYVFSFDRMVSFEGDTGPYLLLAYVRIASIFRKAREQGVAVEDGGETEFDPAHPAEKALALKLLQYPSVLESTADALEPHRLCNYLYTLATAFSGFYEQCPVLKASDEGARGARLRLCSLTQRVVADGLNTLGLPVVEHI